MNWLAEVVCDPKTLRPLERDGDAALVERESGARYPIREGIPVFSGGVVDGLNAKYRKMYDRLAPGYDLAERLYYLVTRKRSVREEYLCELEVAAGMRVLEVSVGTGANVRRMPKDIDFYGLDLSRGMLRRCARNFEKDGRARAALFEGEAEYLPFRSESFDCVFHVGGINFFNDKERALREMVRVRESTRLLPVVSKRGLRACESLRAYWTCEARNSIR